MTAWTASDVDALLRVMDPADDETGGGTAAAAAGAMAAGLAGMVARLSVGREGMEEEGHYRAIDGEARELTEALLRGGRDDSDAFGAVMHAFKLPKGTDVERAERSRAIQEGMVEAARVPLENAERCLKVLDLIGRLEGRSNPNAASDLAVARALAGTALDGCLANVLVNVSSIKDEATASALASRADDLRDAARRRRADHG